MKITISVGFVLTSILLVGCDVREQFDKQVESEMQRIEQHVADDAVKQYEIAKRSGSAMDAYVHAGLVAAAYLQAKDEANYKKWKAIEKSEGARAGMPADF